MPRLPAGRALRGILVAARAMCGEGRLWPSVARTVARAVAADGASAARLARGWVVTDPCAVCPTCQRLRDEERALTDEIDAAYWRFTRCQRAQPPSIAARGAWERRDAVRDELAAHRRETGCGPC